MAFRLKFSGRALREIGEAAEWYEKRSAGLGAEFTDEIGRQTVLIEQAPEGYAEVIPGVRRALLRKFPFGMFFALSGDRIQVLAVLHGARNPARWPKTR